MTASSEGDLMPEPNRPTLSYRYWRLPWLVRIGLVAVIVVGGLVVFSAVRNAAPDRPAPTRAAPTVDAQAPQAPTTSGQIGAGVWLVGADVSPGTYRSAGPNAAGGYCMWSRHDSASGGPLDGIIASDGTYDPGQVAVTIEAGDVVFRTRGCAAFQRVN